jgi:hypothetical protein
MCDAKRLYNLLIPDLGDIHKGRLSEGVRGGSDLSIQMMQDILCEQRPLPVY